MDVPRLDEHEVVLAAPPAQAWEAVLATFGGLQRPVAAAYARVVGCAPARASGWDQVQAGSAVPGFRVEQAEPPSLLVLSGRHRFSRYGIVVRLEPAAGGTRCRLESRAEFPGPLGRAYRAAVVGTRLHVRAVRGLLAQVQRRAERG